MLIEFLLPCSVFVLCYNNLKKWRLLIVVSERSAKRRIVYFDWFRALLPIAIIWIHILPKSDFWNMSLVSEAQHNFVYVTDGILRFSVPIFMMMTGALILNPRKPFDYKNFLKKNTLRLAIIFVVWAAFYAIIEYFLSGSDLRAVLAGLFGNWNYHLWYLLLTLAVYLMAPVLRKICEDRKVLEITLIISILFCFALPTFKDFLVVLQSASSGMNQWFMGVTDGLILGLNHIQIYFEFKFFVFFLLGYFLATEEIPKKWRYRIYTIGVLALILSGIYQIIRYSFTGEIWSGSIGENINLLVLVSSASLFLLMKNLLKKKKLVPKLIQEMSKNSLGIYLIHAFFVALLYKTIFANFDWVYGLTWWGTGLLKICLTVAIYLSSFMFTWLMRRIPVLKRLV